MKKIFLIIVNCVWNLFMMPTGLKKGKGTLLLFCNGYFVDRENLISIGNNCFLKKCTFHIKGTMNKIIINDGCKLVGVSFWISGSGNSIVIGEDTTVGLRTEFAALEGTNITIGKDCMFSHDIRLRTSDSHSIVDDQGNRLNFSEDITIGNHCWIGMQSLIMKGSSIPDNCVLSARSLLNKKYNTDCCIIGGSPAKILKQNINWCREKK